MSDAVTYRIKCPTCGDDMGSVTGPEEIAKREISLEGRPSCSRCQNPEGFSKETPKSSWGW